MNEQKPGRAQQPAGAAADAGVPLVSVVMPSLDQAPFIEAAVRSVLAQSHRRLELLVQDGGSRDGTLEILRALGAEDPRLLWESRADRGPADAVNAALRRARGTVIGWLNSDDLYTAGAIRRAVDALLENRELLAVYGHGEHIDEHGAVIERYPTKPPEAGVQAFAAGCFICQPTMFFRRSLWVMLGDLDASLRTAFDFDYWLRLFTRAPQRIGFIDAVQAQSRLHAGSITLKMRRTVALEGMRLLRDHLGHAPVNWALTHLREISEQSPGQPLSGAQRRQVDDFVQEACLLLSPADGEALRMRAGRLA